MMIDIHSHILPKADHGSHNLEESLKQLITASKYGVKGIVATPHFYPFNDSIEKFLKRRDKAFDELSAANSTGIKIYKGAEVRLTTGLSSLKHIKKLAFENTNYLLLEMPSSTTWNNILLNEIIKLQSLGLTIIIAHIERYSSNQINKLMEFDVLTQINAYSLFSPIKWFRIRKYIKSNVVTFIASDSHIYNYFFAYKYLKKSHNMIGSKFNTYMNNAKNILSL